MGNFYSDIGLEVTFELHCRNRKPQMPSSGPGWAGEGNFCWDEAEAGCHQWKLRYCSLFPPCLYKLHHTPTCPLKVAIKLAGHEICVRVCVCVCMSQARKQLWSKTSLSLSVPSSHLSTISALLSCNYSLNCFAPGYRPLILHTHTHTHTHRGMDTHTHTHGHFWYTYEVLSSCWRTNYVQGRSWARRKCKMRHNLAEAMGCVSRPDEEGGRRGSR